VTTEDGIRESVSAMEAGREFYADQRDDTDGLTDRQKLAYEKLDGIFEKKISGLEVLADDVENITESHDDFINGTWFSDTDEADNRAELNNYLSTAEQHQGIASPGARGGRGGGMGVTSAGGGNGRGARTQSTGAQDFNAGLGTVTGTFDNMTKTVNAGRRLGAALSGQGPVGYGAYNSGFSGPGGFSGVAGSFNSGYGAAMGSFMYGTGYGGYDRENDRKLTAIINQLIHSVASGNIDAISTALTMIARQGKESLRKVALSALTALQSYQKMQSKTSEQMANLDTSNPNEFQAQMGPLQAQMGQYASNRQMIVSLLRDVKSMTDELESMSKSWQDTSLQHQRRQMVFA